MVLIHILSNVTKEKRKVWEVGRRNVMFGLFQLVGASSRLRQRKALRSPLKNPQPVSFMTISRWKMKGKSYFKMN